MDGRSRLPISALVVGLNEDRFLESCLKNLLFCDEVHYIDLGSNDNSIEIAKKYATNIGNHSAVPIVEIIHAELVPKLKNKWVLLTDPDEVLDTTLKDQLIELFKDGIQDNIAEIRVPIQYYFKDKALKGTIWGGNQLSGRLLFNKNCVIFHPSVHRGRRIAKGKTITIPRKQNNLLHHYWVSSYKQFYEKHKRYIHKEGKVLYEHGNRYRIVSQVKETFTSFKVCFYNFKGYKDGLTGLLLSMFWAWYTYSKWTSLKKFQKKI